MFLKSLPSCELTSATQQPIGSHVCVSYLRGQVALTTTYRSLRLLTEKKFSQVWNHRED